MFFNLLSQIANLNIVWKSILVTSLIFVVAAPSYCAGQAVCEKSNKVEVSQELIDRIADSCAAKANTQECLSSEDVKRLVKEALDEYPVPEAPKVEPNTEPESNCEDSTTILVPEKISLSKHYISPGLAVLGDDGFSLGYRFQPENKQWALRATYVNLDTDFTYKTRQLNLGTDNYAHCCWDGWTPPGLRETSVTQQVETDAVLVHFDLPVSMIKNWFK